MAGTLADLFIALFWGILNQVLFTAQVSLVVPEPWETSASRRQLWDHLKMFWISSTARRMLHCCLSSRRQCRVYLDTLLCFLCLCLCVCDTAKQFMNVYRNIMKHLCQLCGLLRWREYRHQTNEVIKSCEGLRCARGLWSLAAFFPWCSCGLPPCHRMPCATRVTRCLWSYHCKLQEFECESGDAIVLACDGVFDVLSSSKAWQMEMESRTFLQIKKRGCPIGFPRICHGYLVVIKLSSIIFSHFP